MKSIRNLLIGMVITGSLVASLHFLHAQETTMPGQVGAVSQDANSLSDLQVMLQVIESVPPAPAASAPMAGTFYSAQHAPGTRLAWPPLPSNNGLPVWNLGDDVYLLDDRQVDYSLPMSSRMAGGGMMGADDLTPAGSGGGGTNGFYSDSFTPPVYTTNDLWLEITGKTNTTAFLTIHPPWNVTNGVYDLFYTTNLSPPETWSWVLRSFAGLTNLVVNNATDAQGFYRLGQTNDLLENDSLGTNFWVAFITMDPYSAGYSSFNPNRELWLYISSQVGASGTVTIPRLGITNAFTVAAGAVTNISITTNAMMGSPVMMNGNYSNYVWWGAFQSNGIHVAASQPVSIYALYYEPYASTAFTCYPTTLLGTNYCLMARPSYYDGESVFAIVATADNTTVNITPSTTADLLATEEADIDLPYDITLQRGQVYQIFSSGFNLNGIPPDIDDVTGTWIKSDKPIAVFAGADMAVVPDAFTGALNPLVQEQLPVDSWGTLTLGLSFAGRTNGDSYRVLAAYDNTVVNITGTVVTITNESGSGPWQVTTNYETVVITNQAGQIWETNLDGPVVFQADKPIQVAQFANGAEFDHFADTNAEGDPCEILLPPTGHYLLTNVVYTPTGLDFYGNPFVFNENFLNLIVPQSAITNTVVDGSIVATSNFVAIGSSGYYGAQLSVTNGTHKVTSSRPVGVEVYGFGPQDAYGYFGGLVK